MSFKKSKIAREPKVTQRLVGSLRSIGSRYIQHQRRKFFVGFTLGFLSIGCIFFVGYLALTHLTDFHVNLLEIVSFGNIHDYSHGVGPTQREKVNILITGIGGGVHDGANLTDTIMLASINFRTKSTTLLSLPRDLYVEYSKWGAGRINELYARGLKDLGSKNAMIYLEEKIKEITGENIDYYAVIDFSGFIKFIDMLGWVDVDVPEDLVDTSYPDEWETGYTTFSIKKWLQTLDGLTALKYARSRHSTSDFDRSRRQTIIIKAIKTKILSLNNIFNPARLKALYYSISANVRTDMPFDEILSVGLFAKDISQEHILSFNLNDSCYQGASYCDRGGFLYAPERELFGGASVLLPNDATAWNVSEYTRINQFANIIFNYPEMYLENYEVQIINATRVSWLANKVALFLKRFGFNVPEKNSVRSIKDYQDKTSIDYYYDPITKTGVPGNSKTLEALSFFVFGDVHEQAYDPSTIEKKAIIEIVLGKNYALMFQ